MARFEDVLPNDLIRELKKIEKNSEKMMSEMVDEAGDIVLSNVKSNMSRVFKTTRSLEKGLKKTKVYKTPSDDGINVNVGFHGYDGIPTKSNPKGTAVALIAQAREYGTSSGEQKKPFFRKSFKKDEIESVMKKVQKRYIDE